MVFCWIMAAILVTLGIGNTGYLIIRSHEKKNNCQNSIKFPLCSKSDEEIAKEELDKIFNDRNEILKDFKIDIHAQDTKTNIVEDNIIEDENELDK